MIYCALHHIYLSIPKNKMGAISSIDMVLPPHVHLCIPEQNITTEDNRIELLEDKLKEHNLFITKTQTTHSANEMQDVINKSSMMIIFLTPETHHSYFQAREIDYAKQEYRKIFYILLDVKFVPQNKTHWINAFIENDDWIQYDKHTNIDTITTRCVNIFTPLPV